MFEYIYLVRFVFKVGAMADFVFGVVDTEGHATTLRQACVVVVSLKDYNDQHCSMVDFPDIKDKVGRYACALGDTFARCQYLVAHNKSTDQINVETAFRKSGFAKELPPPEKWLDSLSFVRSLRKNPKSALFKDAPEDLKNDMGSLYEHLFGEPIKERHSAAADAAALARIMMRVYDKEPEMFILAFPPECASAIRLCAAQALVARATRGIEAPAPAPADAAKKEAPAETPKKEHVTDVSKKDEPVAETPKKEGPRPAPKADWCELPSIEQVVGTKGPDFRVRGPVEMVCNVSDKPYRGHYLVAWDGAMPPGLLEVKYTRRTVRIDTGEHIHVVTSKPKSYAELLRQAGCVGVYTVERQLLHLL